MNALRVAFVLPIASARPIGALKFIYGLAEGLARRGHQAVLLHAPPSPDDERSPQSRGAGPHPWYEFSQPVTSLLVPDLPVTWPSTPADVTVATSWRCVPWVAGYPPSAGQRVLLLLDLESYMLGSVVERRAFASALRQGWSTAVTSAPLRQLVRQHGANWPSLVPCAIDTDLYRLRLPLEAEERSTCGFPARRERAKRTSDAVEAMQLLRASSREDPRIWCFGHYSEGIPTWATRHSAPDDQALSSLYNRTRVFLVPSEYEGFGLPGLEAMACGAALVSTRNGGVESYADESCALLCPPRRPRQLAAAVERLLTDDHLRLQLARSAVRRAKRFSWRQSVDAFEDFLGHATTERGGRAARAAF